MGGKVHPREKPETFGKKKNCKKYSLELVSKTTPQHFLYRILTQFGKYLKKNKRYFVI
jgi:hypothetical protein